MSISQHVETRTSTADGGEYSRSLDSPRQPAMELIVKRHSAMVLGVCRRMLGSADAEDAAQAVFILFWQKGMHLQEERRIVGWLHRTARYVCCNAKRSRVSRARHEQKAVEESPTMNRESADLAQWNEIREILDEEVNRLPEKLRVPFVLFHCEHHSLAEVAELLGATVPTVGTWLKRSREKLASGLRRRGIVIASATLTTMLTHHVTAETVPTAFVAATIETVSAISAKGMAACVPEVAQLVQRGVARGLSKTFWIASSLIVAAIGFPLLVNWLLPALQTRQSPDFPLLQGEWREVAQEQNGGPVNALPPIAYVGTLRINGRHFERFQTLADGRVLGRESGSFVLARSQNTAAIDFKLWQGTIHGIYALEGDTLTICVTRNGEPRPDKLATMKNDDRILTRYKRVP